MFANQKKSKISGCNMSENGANYGFTWPITSSFSCVLHLFCLCSVLSAFYFVHLWPIAELRACGFYMMYLLIYRD